MIVDGRQVGRAAKQADAERLADDWRSLHDRDVVVERAGSG